MNKELEEAAEKANGYNLYAKETKAPIFNEGFKAGAKWQEERNDWSLVSEKQPPIGEELLVQSPFGINHLASWRPAYNIFTCQNKSDSTLDWKWKKI
jgi:hypothetical protein